MADAEADIKAKGRFSAIWIVPIVAVVIGIWMVLYTWANEGPQITITFATAEGLEAGKTKIKALNVDIGLVEDVALGQDFDSVVVTARIEKTESKLLREDTQFWVVRPRIGVEGISGLGTVLSGGYIELAPGLGKSGRRHFTGLENPPVTPSGTPGIQFTLVSDSVDSLSVGNPILYEGFQVGRIESVSFDVASKQMKYGAFIDAPYDDLVSSTTRFWNTSGVEFSATAAGIELRTGSIESMLFGGISFGLPSGVKSGQPVSDGATFRLFSSLEEVEERPFKYGIQYVVEFARSVRGLLPDAPVDYRGLRIGYVEKIMIEELVAVQEGEESSPGAPIPVLIRIEPGRIKMGDTPEAVTEMRRILGDAVAAGLRASLATGNLLTGSLYISLDMYENEPPASIGEFDDYPTLPTIASGLEGIEQRVTRLLDTINSLPLDDLAQSAEDALESVDGLLLEAEKTLGELRGLIASEGIQELPSSLQGTVDELNRALRGVNAFVRSLEEQPNALVFPRKYVPDPEPAAAGARP